MTLAPLAEVSDTALLIKRFDRTEDGQQVHFEEFNQLLGHCSEDKYEACYEHMADFILQNEGVCTHIECDSLFRRVMACILTGNTDAHLKNFAMEYSESGLHLAPCYDLVATACYAQYQTLALGIGGSKNMRIGSVGPKHITQLSKLFDQALMLAVSDLASCLDRAHSAIDASIDGNQLLHRQMEKRWNGTFRSIGTYLSKKQ